MAADFITLVTGFGRCGTSLVLQMLEAAGVPCAGDYPAFEPDQTRLTDFDGKWLAQQTGRAVKVLDPQVPEVRFQPGVYRALWLDRSPRQQAFSQLKLMHIFHGMEITSRGLRRMEQSYAKDRPKALAKLARLGLVHRIAFETILAAPRTAAKTICDFLELPPKLDVMAAVVREREPEARPDLALELELMESRPRRCRVCGCTDRDCSRCVARTGQPCHWVEADLCSACAP